MIPTPSRRHVLPLTFGAALACLAIVVGELSATAASAPGPRPAISAGGGSLPGAAAAVPASTVAGTALPGGATRIGSPSAASLGPSAAANAATPAATPAATAAATACARTTFNRLTEDQRIGQVFIVGLGGSTLDSTTSAAIAANHFGSFWLANNRTGGVTTITPLTRAIQALAPSATAGVPFFIGADQEGGYVQRLSGPGFSTIPTALTQGTYTLSVLRADATTWGRQLRAAGVNLNLAPVMDVVPPGTDALNPPIGQLQREYGHDPVTAGTHGAQFLEGMHDAGVATAIKHFPGLGRVTANTDYSSGVVDTVTTETDPYLGSFADGIAAGTDMVMISLATYTRIDPSHLAVFSPTIITTMLRGNLGFGGVVVSDSLTATAVTSIDPGTRATAFLSAGGDLVLVDTTGVAATMAGAVRALAASNASFRARVENAALHVLEAKAARGMLSCSDAVFDVTGYFAAGTSGATYVPLTPDRLVDSRRALGVATHLTNGVPASFVAVDRAPADPSRNVPSSAIAVTGNLTVTGQTAGGYFSLTPSKPSAIPPTSTLNFPPGDVRANNVTARLGSGGALWVTYAATPAGATADVVFDVTGYFLPGTSGATYVSLTPNRLVDSRSGTRLGLAASLANGVPAAFQVTGRVPADPSRNVPATATAVTGNLTIVSPTSRGYVSLTPAAPTGIPATSTLNAPAGDVRANGVTVRLGAGGRLWVTFLGSAGSTADVVFDVTGYFAPGTAGATYFPLVPNRLVDSRPGVHLGLAASLSTGIPASFQVSGRVPTDPTRNVPAAAIAITGNLTAVNETTRGFLTLAPAPGSATSTLNFPAGDIRANGVATRLGTGGVLWVTLQGSPG